MSGWHGGPAFPFPVLHGSNAPTGMTLRDYFAAKAMEALIHSGATVQRHTADGILTVPARVAIPPLAYEYADAMLAAREVQA